MEAGLAIAEMIASLSIPTVSLVLGRRTFYRSSDGRICGLFFRSTKCYDGDPSGTFNGMFIGVAQTYRNMEKIQDRITTFFQNTPEHLRNVWKS